MAAEAAIHDSLPPGALSFFPTTSTETTMRAWHTKWPCVYILASKPNGVLYTGVTSSLRDRVAVHKQDLIEGFTKRYGIHRLVYYEMHDTMDEAILRETRVKKWPRAWKIRLIQGLNPEWTDLFDERTGAILDGPADCDRIRR